MRISKQQREANTLACKDLIRAGDIVALKDLLPHSSVNYNGAELVMFAITVNQPQCLEVMLPFFSAPTHAKMAIRKALFYRHNECLKVLAKVASDSVLSERLITTILDHNFDAAKVLLPYYNPEYDAGAALAAATFVNNTELMDLLFPHSPVDIALDYKTQPGGAYLLELIAQSELKQKMLNEIPPSPRHPNKKM